jgi:hypothetical protein
MLDQLRAALEMEVGRSDRDDAGEGIALCALALRAIANLDRLQFALD